MLAGFHNISLVIIEEQTGSAINNAMSSQLL